MHGSGANVRVYVYIYAICLFLTIHPDEHVHGCISKYADGQD